jgi:hypothetical protein
MRAFSLLPASEWWGLLSWVLLTCLYVHLIPGYVLGGDNGEFVALSRAGGVAHPPGYPLYVGYLRLFTGISPNPAYASGLATVVLGSGQLIGLYAALRAFGYHQYISAMVISFYGTSSLAIYLNTHAEVFALNGLIAALLLLAYALSRRINAWLGLAVTAWLFGLGFSNHHTIVLIVPVVFCALKNCCVRIGRGRRVWALAIAVILFLSGLSPYLFLFGWSKQYQGNILSWGNIVGWRELFHHFLRRDYGTFVLVPRRTDFDYGRQIFLLWESLYWSWSLLLPFVVGSLLSGVYGFFFCPVRRGVLLPVWLSIVLSGPVLLLGFNSPFAGIVERFHALPLMLISIPAAHGLTMAWELWRRYFESPLFQGQSLGLRLPWGGPMVMVGLILFAGYFNFSIASRRMSNRLSRQVHDMVLNGAKGLPKGSVVLVSGDHQTLGFNGMQQGFGYRKDLLFVSPSMLVAPWYRDRLASILGFRSGIRSADREVWIQAIVSASHRLGRPVFVHPVWSQLLPESLSYQAGLFRRVVPEARMVPDPSRIYANHARLFSSFRRPPREILGDSWSDAAAYGYEVAWRSLSDDLRRLGSDKLAQQALQQLKRYEVCRTLDCGGP